jgi:hypothetical protein
MCIFSSNVESMSPENAVLFIDLSEYPEFAAISPRKTFYLWDSLSNAEVVFEIEPDSSVKQIWPVLGHTDLTKADLEKWLTKDLAEGRDSMCRQAR